MSTLNLSPKNPAVMVVLAVGAVWLLTQRKASAATITRPYGSSAAAQTPAVAAYYAKPSTAAQYASYAQGRSLVPTSTGAAPSPIAAGLDLVNTLVKTFTPGFSTGSSGYFAQNLGTGVSAEADGTIGEAAARSYYLEHADEFIPDMPVITADMTNRALLEGMSEY